MPLQDNPQAAAAQEMEQLERRALELRQAQEKLSRLRHL
jgi:hypothetical protein